MELWEVKYVRINTQKTHLRLFYKKTWCLHINGFMLETPTEHKYLAFLAHTLMQVDLCKVVTDIMNSL